MRCSGFCSDPRNKRSYLHTCSHNHERLIIIEFLGIGLKARDLNGAFLLPWAQEVPSSNLGAPTIHLQPVLESPPHDESLQTRRPCRVELGSRKSSRRYPKKGRIRHSF